MTQRLGYCPNDWVKHLTQLLVQNNPIAGVVHILTSVFNPAFFRVQKYYFQFCSVFFTPEDHPPMSSTATIQIHIEDKNDNVPILKENMVSVCQSDEKSSTEITAYDLDGDPYSGPFSFEIMGDHKEEWSFDPSHGK